LPLALAAPHTPLAAEAAARAPRRVARRRSFSTRGNLENLLWAKATRDGLRESGYVEGPEPSSSNFRYRRRTLRRVPKLLAEVNPVARRCDRDDRPRFRSFRGQEPTSTTPSSWAGRADPVRSRIRREGLARRAQHHGCVESRGCTDRQMARAPKEWFQRFRVVAILRNGRGIPTHALFWAEAQGTSARGIGADGVTAWNAQSPGEFEPAFTSMAQTGHRARRWSFWADPMLGYTDASRPSSRQKHA